MMTSETFDDATTLMAGTGLLAQIASGLGQADVGEALPAGTHRRWSYLIRSEGYEALVIAWPPGTGLAMHDHSGSLAALHVVGGRLRERYLDRDGAPLERWLDAGHTLELGADHMHEMINLGDVEAVSVHVYAPPLSDNDFRVDAEIDLRPASSRPPIAVGSAPLAE